MHILLVVGENPDAFLVAFRNTDFFSVKVFNSLSPDFNFHSFFDVSAVQKVW